MQEQSERQLTVETLVEKMDAVPTFAIMRDVNGSKRFVPMSFADDIPAGKAAPQVCAFFVDPAEAKQALNQARAACPDMHLVLGAMPLGHAFALTVGWAEAIGEHPFTIRGSRELTKGTRQRVVQQLDEAGLPSYWQIPVVVCEALSSPTVLPIFLSLESLADTWKAAGHEGPPPRRLSIVDLRLLSNEMLAPISKTRTDWTVVRFLGVEAAHQLVANGIDEVNASGGFGSGKGSGDEAALTAAAEAQATAARAAALAEDPEIEPPPLEVEVDATLAEPEDPEIESPPLEVEVDATLAEDDPETEPPPLEVEVKVGGPVRGPVEIVD